MQETFNTIMSYNKLDIILFIIIATQLIIGFTSGYKKTIYHSVKYLGAYILTRVAYKLIMPWLGTSAMYLGFQDTINNFIIDKMPNNFNLITKYPIDRYIFNILLFVSMLIFLRLIIIGWHPQVNLLDRLLGLVVAMAKVVVIITILVLLITPFVEMAEPITGGNIINESKIVQMIKPFNPFLNGSKIEF